MASDERTASGGRPPALPPELVTIFLDLEEDAQRLYLHLLRTGAARPGWETFTEMLTQLREDGRTRDLIARLERTSSREPWALGAIRRLPPKSDH